MNDRIVKKGEDARQGEILRDPGEPRREEPIVETKEEARQGETWAPMQRVLFGGIALVVIAFVILFLVFAL